MLLVSLGYNKKILHLFAGVLACEACLVDKIEFIDGEFGIKLDCSIVDRDVVILFSSFPKQMESLIMFMMLMRLLRDSKPASLTICCPYLFYPKSDLLKEDGVLLPVEIFVQHCVQAKCGRFITLDSHNDGVISLFCKELGCPRDGMVSDDRDVRLIDLFCRTESVNFSFVSCSALFIFREYMASNILNDICLPVVFVSPDVGGEVRIRVFSEYFDIPFVVMSKDVVRRESVLVSGSIERTAIIVDDVIDTGFTVISAIDILRNSGVCDVYVIATHATSTSSLLRIADIDIVRRVVVSDTNFQADIDSDCNGKIVVIDAFSKIAECI